MAGAVTTNRGLLKELGAMLPYLGTLTMRLFTNDYVPAATSRPDEFRQATFPGYAPRKLADWNQPFINRDGMAEVNACLATWTLTVAGTAQQVYGYYVTEGPGIAGVVWAERAPAPTPMAARGDTFSVQPTRTLSNPP